MTFFSVLKAVNVALRAMNCPICVTKACPRANSVEVKGTGEIR